MGMAASQARYLGLAARKTNCEYQGQQINQARTTLGSQSAELWNQMLGMEVPTVPNQEDYVKTQYSFSDGQNSFEITDMVPSDEEEGYNYAIKYRYYEKEIVGVENANTNPQAKYDNVSITKLDTQTFTYNTDHFEWTDAEGNTNTLTEITDKNELASAKAKLQAAGVTINDGDKIYSAGAGNFYVGPELTGTSTLTDKTIQSGFSADYKLGNTSVKVADKTDVNTKAALDKIKEDNPDSKIAEAIANGEDVYTFVKNGTTYYACAEDLDECIASAADSTGEVSKLDQQKSLKQYYTSQIDKEVVESDYVLLDDASGSGRFSTIKFKNNYGSTTFNLNTESTTNTEAYNNAMNQYYYDTQQYEKKNADINAKTSIIQQQDRTLELRLKQLDTEHSALQTEMEAVKKVMDKNVEDTFKTFNG